MLKTFTIKTHNRIEFVDITNLVSDFVKEIGVKSGICTIFIPHTTAGITINENADPDVKTDINTHLSKLIPNSNSFLHAEGNSDAHIKAGLLGFSQTVIIENNSLLLGIWQDIYFCEFDGARNRKFHVKIQPD